MLLVEDNPVNRELIQQQLEELGWHVGTAEDGQAALSLWPSDSWDVVLTDINMPVMDGYELAQTLRARGEKVPILAITATALASERERCRQAGIDGCCSSPWIWNGCQRRWTATFLPATAGHPRRPRGRGCR